MLQLNKLRSKEVLTAVGTLAGAIGIGFIMQSSDTAEAHYGRAAEAEQAPVLKGASAENSVIEMEDITLTSGEYDTGISAPQAEAGVITASAPQSVLETPQVPPVAEVTLDETDTCEMVADARPVAGAMVNLSMDAACYPNERVTVHHNGMIFTETTSDEGRLDIRVPALSEAAVYIIAFPNGEGAVAQADVIDLADYDRAVLQWKGNTGFEIHAREFGADYGSEGHIWQGQPGDVAATVTGDSGMITRLGDTDAAEPLLAEVYTFPRGNNGRSGSVALSVETEVTVANCGLEVEAQSLELQADGLVKTQNLTLPVPDCEAEGSFLVLNNLLQDLKVAVN